MAGNTYKIIELVGTSEESLEEAITSAVGRAIVTSCSADNMASLLAICPR